MPRRNSRRFSVALFVALATGSMLSGCSQASSFDKVAPRIESGLVSDARFTDAYVEKNVQLGGSWSFQVYVTTEADVFGAEHLEAVLTVVAGEVATSPASGVTVHARNPQGDVMLFPQAVAELGLTVKGKADAVYVPLDDLAQFADE